MSYTCRSPRPSPSIQRLTANPPRFGHDAHRAIHGPKVVVSPGLCLVPADINRRLGFLPSTGLQLDFRIGSGIFGLTVNVGLPVWQLALRNAQICEHRCGQSIYMDMSTRNFLSSAPVEEATIQERMAK